MAAGHCLDSTHHQNDAVDTRLNHSCPSTEICLIITGHCCCKQSEKHKKYLDFWPKSLAGGLGFLTNAITNYIPHHIKQRTQAKLHISNVKADQDRRSHFLNKPYQKIYRTMFEKRLSHPLNS